MTFLENLQELLPPTCDVLEADSISATVKRKHVHKPWNRTCTKFTCTSKARLVFNADSRTSFESSTSYPASIHIRVHTLHNRHRHIWSTHLSFQPPVTCSVYAVDIVSVAQGVCTPRLPSALYVVTVRQQATDLHQSTWTNTHGLSFYRAERGKCFSCLLG